MYAHKGVPGVRIPLSPPARKLPISHRYTATCPLLSVKIDFSFASIQENIRYLLVLPAWFGFGVLARFIVNPDSPSAGNNGAKSAVAVHTGDYTWREMMRTRTFYLLWAEFACGSLAGLMIIGHLAKIVAVQSGGAIQFGFIFVAILAVFNAGGRILAGLVSDRIGRLKTICFVCVTQAIVMFIFSKNSTVVSFLIGSAMVGFSYGACLSLFPSVCSDFWGTRNLGLNYGLLFTARATFQRGVSLCKNRMPTFLSQTRHQSRT